MAFSDNPTVDDCAKMSEESELKLRSFFNKKTGFLSRVETPDYAVDFDMELIDKKSDVTGNKFAVQVKSTIKSTIVTKNNIQNVSFSFKTSRLGYLSRRLPGLGIITLYDESTQTTYFDYVEVLIDRITIQKGNETWKKQQKVNINIPISNELTFSKIQEIYIKYSQQFLNHKILMSQHGHIHGLYSFTDEKEIQDQNPTNLLLIHGPSLINLKEYNIIIRLVEKCALRNISSSPKLSLYAMIAYLETGNAIPAKQHLIRVEQYKKEYGKHELEMFAFASPKIEFLLGFISSKEYGSLIKKIEKTIHSPINIANAKLHSLFLEVHSRETGDPDIELEKRLEALFNEIERIDILELNKYYLSIQHCDTIYLYASSLLSKVLHQCTISKMIPIQLNTSELEKASNQALRLINLCNSKLTSCREFALNSNNKILEAHLNLKNGQYLLDEKWKILLSQGVEPWSSKIQYQFQHGINKLMDAFEIFNSKLFYQECHKCLNTTLDIKRIYKYCYSLELDGPKNENLEHILKEIELNTGMKSFTSMVKKLLNQ